MTVADALSRDAVGDDLCHRCREQVRATVERTLPNILDVLREQVKEFGDLNVFAENNRHYFLDEDGLLCRMDDEILRIIVPKTSVSTVLAYFHGSRACGHYGIARTAFRVRSRFWWMQWKQDVKETVRTCANCSIQRLSRPGRQGKMKTWHPLRRFQVVAMDITEVSPPSTAGNKKIIVIRDLLSRYIWAIPAKDE